MQYVKKSELLQNPGNSIRYVITAREKYWTKIKGTDAIADIFCWCKDRIYTWSQTMAGWLILWCLPGRLQSGLCLMAAHSVNTLQLVSVCNQAMDVSWAYLIGRSSPVVSARTVLNMVLRSSAWQTGVEIIAEKLSENTLLILETLDIDYCGVEWGDGPCT